MIVKDHAQSIAAASRWLRKFGICILPILLFGLALVVRVPATRSALPYTHAWDEPFVMNPAVRTIKTGDWNPRFAIYPGGYIHLQTFAASLAVFRMAGSGDLAYLNELPTADETKYLWTIPHPEIYRMGRLLSALFGALTVVATFYLGQAAYGGVAGLLGALLLCFSRLAITCSSSIITDTPATFFTVLALLLSVRVLRSDSDERASYIAAGAMTGFAAAMKYNAGIVFIGFLAAHFLRGRRGGRLLSADLGLYLVLSAIAFVVATPYVILDYSEFMRGMIYNLRHYQFGSHNASTVTAWQNFLAYVADFQNQGFSPIVVYAAFVGCALGFALRIRVHMVLMGFCAFYIWYFSGLKVHFFRNMMPVLPLVALLASVPMAAVLCFPRRVENRRLRMGRLAGTVVIGLMLMVGVVRGGLETVAGMRDNVDSRRQVLNCIRKNLPANAKVAVDSNLHFYLPPSTPKSIRELNLFDKPNSYFAENGISYVVIAGNYEYPGSSAAESAASAWLNGRFARLQTIAEFGSGTLKFGQVPMSPAVRLCRFNDHKDPRPAPGLLPGLAMKAYGRAIPDFETGALQLWSSGRIFGELEITTPSTSLITTMSGIHKDGQYPKVRITVQAATGSSETIVAKEAVVTGWNSYPTQTFPCALQPGWWRVSFDFLNGEPVDFLKDTSARTFGVKLVRVE